MADKPDDVKIEVFTIDDEPGGDNCYCAIVMGWKDVYDDWYNTGIVIRETDPTIAFNKARAEASECGWWS